MTDQLELELDLDLDPVGLRARALRGIPSIRKTEPPSFDRMCEMCAVEAYVLAVAVSGGNRAVGRYSESDESGIRNKCSGGRVNPLLKDAWKVPPKGKRVIALALLDAADREEDKRASG